LPVFPVAQRDARPLFGPGEEESAMAGRSFFPPRLRETFANRSAPDLHCLLTLA